MMLEVREQAMHFFVVFLRVCLLFRLLRYCPPVRWVTENDSFSLPAADSPRCVFPCNTHTHTHHAKGNLTDMSKYSLDDFLGAIHFHSLPSVMSVVGRAARKRHSHCSLHSTRESSCVH